MKNTLFALTLASVSLYAQGGAPAIKPGTIVPPAETFNASLSSAENQMLTLVKAMPADKFNFAPTAATFAASQKTDYTGVKTFGGLAIHIAQANYFLAGPIGGLKPDIDAASLAGLKDKDEIIAALAASFAFVHKSIDTLTPENAFQSVRGPMTRATQAAFVMSHTADEYGQLVEYLRMNGIVPPASQKK
jgi:hypothetical protein